MPVADNRKGAINSAKASSVGQAFPATAGLIADQIGAHADFADNGNRFIIILNRLSNWEKHNLLVFTIKRTENIVLNVGGNSITVGRMSGIGALVRVRGDCPTVQDKGNASAQIIFGKHDFVDGEPIFPLMRELSQAATNAVDAFIEAFP